CGIAFEVDRLFQKLFYFRHSLINTLRVERVDFVSGLKSSHKHVWGHGVAILRSDGINVFLGEKEMAEIEHLQIRLQEFLRNLFVQFLPGVLAFLQESPDRHRHRFSRTGRCGWSRERGRKKDCAKEE